jgi:hypothetical protein
MRAFVSVEHTAMQIVYDGIVSVECKRMCDDTCG